MTSRSSAAVLVALAASPKTADALPLAFDAPPMAMLFWPPAFAPTLRLVEPMAVEPDPLAVAA